LTPAREKIAPRAVSFAFSEFFPLGYLSHKQVAPARSTEISIL
jgi:hypothetical protein